MQLVCHPVSYLWDSVSGDTSEDLVQMLEGSFESLAKVRTLQRLKCSGRWQARLCTPCTTPGYALLADRNGAILDALQALADKVAAPLAQRHFRHLQLTGDLLIGSAGSGRQNNPAPLRQTLGRGRRLRQLVQRGLRGGQAR